MNGPFIVEWNAPHWRVLELGMEPIADRVVAEVKTKFAASVILRLARGGFA